MKRRLVRVALGAAVGGALGFAYWYFVGCSSGGCPITSDPAVSTIYGAVVGVAFTGL